VTRARPDRGDHAISRKAIAQGMSDCLRCPVCSCAAYLALFAHETAGAARIRHSLRPLFEEGGTISKTSGASRRENVKLRLPSLRGAKRRSNPSFFMPPDGLLRFALMHKRSAFVADNDGMAV
jgi:hypothetical protein